MFDQAHDHARPDAGSMPVVVFQICFIQKFIHDTSSLKTMPRCLTSRSIETPSPIIPSQIEVKRDSGESISDREKVPPRPISSLHGGATMRELPLDVFCSGGRELSRLRHSSF